METEEIIVSLEDCVTEKHVTVHNNSSCSAQTNDYYQNEMDRLIFFYYYLLYN